MRTLPGERDVQIPLTGGMLDGISPAGEASAADFRVLLNTATDQERGMARMGGWSEWVSDVAGYSNENLHDQLTGAQGTVENGCFTAADGQREAITMLFEAPASTGALYFLAGTRSRLYASTGRGRNYRLIADGLGGEFIPGESPWPKVKMRGVQIGDFALFTNGVNPVLAWPLGGGPIPVTTIGTVGLVIGGTGYTTSVAVAVTGGTGSGARVNITAVAGVITAITVSDGGTGYSIGDVLTVVGGDANATMSVVFFGLDRVWSAREITELVELGILRANVICSWQGFVFIADVNVEGSEEHSQIYWCSFNRPLEWATGGESSAGMYDFGQGETVLAIAPIGGNLRVYTDKAIYIVSFVGGNVIFSFQEIYRGDQALAFKESFVNLGGAHFWLTQESCAILGEYDKTPIRLSWLHKATGYVFKGMDGRLLKNCPVPFEAFNPIDRERCYQIAAGFDDRRSDIWLSWPTERTSAETPDDPLDFDGVRRMTLKYNVRYAKATLVDHGFSAFASARLSAWETLRDFVIQYGVCNDSDACDPLPPC